MERLLDERAGGRRRHDEFCRCANPRDATNRRTVDLPQRGHQKLTLGTDVGRNESHEPRRIAICDLGNLGCSGQRRLR